MADYPGAIPALSTVTNADALAVAHLNEGQDEIVAICTELGINPKSIDDTVAAEASPADVADVLDQFANVLKAIAGVGHWYDAAVPQRNMIMFHGGGQVATADCWVGWGSIVAVANKNLVQFAVPFYGTARLKRVYVEILTPTGADDTLEILVCAGANPVNAVRSVIPPSSAARIYRREYDPNSELFGFAPNFSGFDCLGVRMLDYGTTPSTQIGAVGIEYDGAY